MLHVYYLKMYGQIPNRVLSLLHFPCTYILGPSPSCSVPGKLTSVPCLLDSAWVWLMRSSSSWSGDWREERWGYALHSLVPSLPQLLPGPSLLQLQLSQDSVTTFSACHFEFIDPLQLLASLIYLILPTHYK